MDNHNIYYASNAQTDIFSQNTRSKFENNIQKEHLDYIPDDDLEVAIKSITFDNRLKKAQINQQEKEPHIIIFQKKKGSISTNDLYKFPNVQEKFNFLKKSNDNVYFNGGRDYVTTIKNVPLSAKETFYLEGKQDKYTSFNIVFPDDGYPWNNGVMHNIFLNEQILYSNSDFINLLNFVLDNLLYKSTQSPKFIIAPNGSVYASNLDNLQIYVGSQIFDNFLDDSSLNPKEFTRVTQLIIHSDFKFLRGKKKVFNYRYKKFPFKNFINTIFSIKDAKFVELKEGKIVDGIKNINKLDVRLIKSNICEYNIRNGEFDKIMTYFDSSNFKNDTVVKVDFINPIFHATNKDFLCNAKFQILDADTGEQPNLSSGAPTYIQTIVRKRKMKERKNIFLESSCPISQHIFPSNTNMSFKTKLPEHFDLYGDWYLNLKKLIIPSKLNNIYKKLCSVVYIENDRWGGYVNPEDGFYPDIETLLKNLEDKLQKAQIPISMYLNDGKVLITGNTNTESQIIVSPHLSMILGLDDELSEFKNDFSIQKTIVGKNMPDINFLLPRNIVITCDLVEYSIFSAQQLKVLRLIANTKNTDSPFLEFEFLQDEPVKMAIKDFETIQINILDVTGIVVNTESKLPSYFEMELVKY